MSLQPRQLCTKHFVRVVTCVPERNMDFNDSLWVTKFIIIIIIILGRQKHSKPKLRKSVHHSIRQARSITREF